MVIPEMEYFKALYNCVQARPRPEDVAALALEALRGALQPAQERVLEKASRYALKNLVTGYTSMLQDFKGAPSAEVQVQKALELIACAKTGDPAIAVWSRDPDRVFAFITAVGSVIGFDPAHTDFKRDRHNRVARRLHEPEMPWKGHRAYNKRWRLLKRIHVKATRMVREIQKCGMARTSKSSFATRLSYEEFATDLPTACFVAYMTANLSRRSTFTVTSQAAAFDKVAKALYLHAAGRPHGTNWFAVAHVMPDPIVLANLNDEQKGRLLGLATKEMEEVGAFLEAEWEKFDPKPDRLHMVVSRGQDSTTWNQAAGAWNKAREQWMNLLYATGNDALLDVLCPGKAMRLMAADVTAWHQRAGDTVHPDQRVWSVLPHPWTVLDLGQTFVPYITRSLIEEICKENNAKSEGWVKPRGERIAAEWSPTPELVHGVAVSSPRLAKILRHAGAFSGKQKEHVPNVRVTRDEHGAALLAEEGDDDSGGYRQ